MLKYFFSNQCKDRGSLFQGLSVWDNEEYHSLQGSYPVISLTFADVKGTTFETARNAIIQKLIKLYSIHSYIKTDEILVKEDWDYINSLKKDMADDTASVVLRK